MNHTASSEDEQGQPLLPAQTSPEQNLQLKESGIFQRPIIYLIYHSCQKESDLHEHEVGGWVEVLQTDE